MPVMGTSRTILPPRLIKLCAPSLAGWSLLASPHPGGAQFGWDQRHASFETGAARPPQNPARNEFNQISSLQTFPTAVCVPQPQSRRKPGPIWPAIGKLTSGSRLSPGLQVLVFPALPIFAQSVENTEFISGLALRMTLLLNATIGLMPPRTDLMLRSAPPGARLEARTILMPVELGQHPRAASFASPAATV